MTYWKLFYNYLLIGLFSIGGGHAAIPLIQELIVDNLHWMTMEEYTSLVTIAEITPGPIAVNSSTFVGLKVAGPMGILVATLGCILPSCIIVSIIALLYKKYKSISAFQNVLLFLRPVVVALIAAAGLSILKLVLFQGEQAGLQSFQPVSFALFGMGVYLLAGRKWNPIAVIFLCGFCNVIISFIL